MAIEKRTPSEYLRDRWPSIIQLGLPALAVFLLPLFVGFDDNLANLVLFIAIYMLLALGLNIVVGFTGLLDLGFVSFMAVGAVVTCLCLVMTVHPETGELLFPVAVTAIQPGNHPLIFPFSYILILFISGAVCALIGVLRGIPTLRLSGDYYAIVTLGIAEIIFLFLFNEEWLSGGAFGIKLTRASRPQLLGEPLYWDTPHFYYLTFFLLVLVVAVMYSMQNSRMGRAWASIRMDETAAKSCGVNVAGYKMIAFAVSGFIGGVGGSIYAIWQGSVTIRSLEVWQSILILCCVVLGGMGNIKGVLLGTGILMIISEILRYPLFGLGRIPPEARYLVYGILIVLLMRFRPQGLIPMKPAKVDVTEDDLKRVREAPSPLFHLETASAADGAEAPAETGPAGPDGDPS